MEQPKLIIVGQQAMTPEEFEAHRRNLDWRNASRRERRRADPEYRARWAASTRERRWRLEGKTGVVLRAVASLHGLKCTGPTERTGCVCQKLTMYERMGEIR